MQGGMQAKGLRKSKNGPFSRIQENLPALLRNYLKINKLRWSCAVCAIESLGLALLSASQWRDFHPHLGMTFQADVPIWEELVDGAPASLGVSFVSNHIVE
jgi:hypothetical protein